MTINKGAKIAIVIGIPITLFGIAALLDVYASSQIQFRSSNVENFDWADLSIDINMLTCNPTFMPTSFDKITADLSYKSTRIGQFTLWGTSIMPYSTADVKSRFNVDGMNVLKMIFGGMVAGFTGQKSEYNPNDFNIYFKIDKNILGIIPFSYEKFYTMSEFSSILQGRNQNWNC